MIEIPTVDIQSGIDTDTQGVATIAAAAADAAGSLGMFFVTGHGLTRAYLAELSASWRVFFANSPEYKAQVACVNGRGYSPALSPGDATREYKESFNLMYPQPRGTWPPDARLCRQLRDAFATFNALSVSLLGLLARGLGKSEDYFVSLVGASASVLRVIHYPASSVPLAAPWRCEPHSDYGTLSVLLIDDAPGGLQLQTSTDTWEDIRVPPQRLLVNVGDTLETWTNGQLIAPVHRVVNPSKKDAETSSRQAIVFFHNPESIRQKVIDYLRG